MKAMSPVARTLAVVVSLTGLVLMSVIAVGPAVASQQESGQQAVEEDELARRIRAEVERILAELRREGLLLGPVQQEARAAMEREMQRAMELREREMQRATQLRERQMEEVQRQLEQARARMEPLRLTVGDLHVIGGCERFADDVLDHAEEVGLTEEQEDRIRDLQREYRRQRIQRRADIEVAEMDLEALSRQEDADLVTIRAQLEELSTLRIDEQMAGLQLQRDVRQVLTDDQVQQLEERHGDRDLRVIVRRSTWPGC